MLPEQQQRILGYFIEEARDHLNTIEQGLLNLQETLNDPEMINEVFRAAHSIKGGAAMLGLSSIQRTSHRLEDCFKVLKENPITVDQKLESLFLGVSDTLKALLEHLSGPFGLSEEAANTLMSEAEPVFGWLNEHLESLLSTTGGTNIKVSTLHEPEQVPVVNTPVPSAIDWQQFQNQVLQKLRDMLQLFKQDATTASRKGLSACCEYLAVIGNDLKLTSWCHLCKGAARAVENPDNSYLTLAKVIITEIKAAQELVLAGRDSEITISPQLEVLISLPDIELLELSSDFFENDVLEVNVHPDKVESLSVHDFQVLDVGNVDRTDDLFNISFDDINSSTQGYDGDDIGLFVSSGFDIDEKDISSESDDSDDTIESLFELTEEFEYVNNVDFDIDIENNDVNNVESDIDEKIESLLDLDSEISSDINSDINGGAVNDKINSPFEMSELLEALALFEGTTNITQYHPGPEVGIAELSELSELFKDEIKELDDTWHSEPPTVSVELSEHSTDNYVNDSELDDLLVFEDSTNFSERPSRGQGELTVVQLFGSFLDEDEDDVSSYDNLDSELPEVTPDSNVIYLDDVSTESVTLFEDVGSDVSLDNLLTEETNISSLDEIDDIFATVVDVSAPVWELPEVTDDDFASFWISQTTDVTHQLEQSLFAATQSNDIFSDNLESLDILDDSITQIIEDVADDDSDNIELALEEVSLTGAVDDVEDAFVLESAPSVEELESKPDNIEEFDGVDLSSDEFTALEALLGNDVIPSPVIEASNNYVVENVLSSDVDNNNYVDEFGDLEKMLSLASDNIPGASKRDKGVSSRAATRRTARFEQLMKVPVKHLDDMSNLVGELVVNRNTLEQDQERLRQSLDNLLIQIHHLSDVGARMQELYERSLLEASLLATRKYGVGGGYSVAVSNKDSDRGFSELEMDRFTPFHTLSQEMIELIVRVRESASDIDFVTEETERVARQFRQVTTQLQEGLTRARMQYCSVKREHSLK